MTDAVALCTHVTPACPVSATTYGYRPVLGGNTFFLVLFALLTVAQLVIGLRKRTPWFTFTVSLACLGEAIGYAGRLIMHHNPWSGAGFKIQIIMLILSPSFLAAGLYLTLKHLVLAFGAEKSRLRPDLYPKIFIGCDVFSILLQATGGGVAASEQSKLLDVGNDIMITGIVFQVATMALCICLAFDFGYALLKGSARRTAAEKSEASDHDQVSQPRFHFYLACSAVAFIAVFIRCVYRIPEMAGGWGNPLMQDENEFLILDGTMIALASILLTIAHPGIFFPAFREGTLTATTEG